MICFKAGDILAIRRWREVMNDCSLTWARRGMRELALSGISLYEAVVRIRGWLMAKDDPATEKLEPHYFPMSDLILLLTDWS